MHMIFKRQLVLQMNTISQNQRLSDALAPLVATIAEILEEKLRGMADTQTAQKNAPALESRKSTHPKYHPLMRKKEAAKYFNVSPRTIDKWIRRRLLPHYKLDRVILIKPSDVEQFWDENFRVAAKW